MQNSNLPEAVQMSPAQAFKLSSWAIGAVVSSFASRWVLTHHADGLAWERAVIALVPLVPGLLWIRSIARWMRPLDELQRRIQCEAWLFAATATLLLSTATHLLASARIPGWDRLPRDLGWEGTFAVAFLLYCIGCMLTTRRYK